MEYPYLILLLIALGAAAAVWAGRRLGFSPLLGYLAFGVALAPFRRHLFQDAHAVEVVAESGVILLMFFIGLEFHLDRLRAFWKRCLGGGSLQMLLAGSGAFGASLLAGLSPTAAVVVGLMVAFSSTAVVMRLHEERGDLDGYRGRTALGVLLTQDVAAVAALALLPLAAEWTGSAPGGAGGRGLALRLGVLVVVLPLLFLVVRWVFPRVFLRAASARSPELLTWLSMAACFAAALAARTAGGSFAVGAFMGGLVLSSSPTAAQIRAELNTLRSLSLGFFFISMGWLVDFEVLAAAPLAVVAAFTGFVALKAATTSVALLVIRVPFALALAVGLALAQIGEFSLVVGHQALRHGLLDENTHGVMLAAALLSMAVTPVLFAAADRVARRSPRPDEADVASGEPAGAVVVGYGPVGRTVERLLTDFGLDPVVVDLNLATVKQLQAKGRKAVYGDGRRREVLQEAGVPAARFVVVTLPDLEGRMGVVSTARSLNPRVMILVRARFLREYEGLSSAGSSVIRFEECEVAAALAEHLLLTRDLPPERIREEVERIRCAFEETIPAAEKADRKDPAPGL